MRPDDNSPSPVETLAATGRRAGRSEYTPLALLASLVLAVTLFLLSADRLFVAVGDNKIKYGYFLIAGLWLFDPVRMSKAAAAALARVPKATAAVFLPLAIAVATSADPKGSVWWTLWLAFDLFTVATVYAFLKVWQFPEQRVTDIVVGALALIAGFGMLQFVSIYFFGRIIFAPQMHLDVYRINGMAGWPHFLNIFSFLLLPLVVQREKIGAVARIVVAVLLFVLVQSTAKTGWVLFVALGALLALLNSRAFVRNYILFIVPVAVVALVLPTPSLKPGGEAVRGTEKVTRFAADLDVTDSKTSGTDRMLINEMGIEVWKRHPWFGVGPRAFDTYVWTRFDQELPGANKLDGNRNVNAKNENVWIELLAETGAPFTIGVACILAWALWVRRWAFANRTHLGAWMALVLYYAISAQVSQNGLLTLVYAVFGIYFYARETHDSQ